MNKQQDVSMLILTAQLEILRRIDRIENYLGNKDKAYYQTPYQHRSELYVELKGDAETLQGEIEETEREG